MSLTASQFWRLEIQGDGVEPCGSGRSRRRGSGGKEKARGRERNTKEGKDSEVWEIGRFERCGRFGRLGGLGRLGRLGRFGRFGKLGDSGDWENREIREIGENHYMRQKLRTSWNPGGFERLGVWEIRESGRSRRLGDWEIWRLGRLGKIIICGKK